MLHIACENGRVHIAESLLMANADINATFGENIETPLMTAAHKGRPMIVSLLLRYGCNVLALNKNEMNAFCIAASYGSREHAAVIEHIYSHLINNPQKYSKNVMQQLINQQDKQLKQTPYMLACKTGHQVLISAVLECQVNVKKKDANGKFGSDLIPKTSVQFINFEKLKQFERE